MCGWVDGRKMDEGRVVGWIGEWMGGWMSRGWMDRGLMGAAGWIYLLKSEDI